MVSGYEYDHKVAEVKIEKVEKEDFESCLCPLLEPKVDGIGLPPPGGQSFSRNLKRGKCAGFIWQKLLRRLVGERQSRRGYNVVYVNGVQPIKE